MATTGNDLASKVFDRLFDQRGRKRTTRLLVHPGARTHRRGAKFRTVDAQPDAVQDGQGGVVDLL